MHEEDDATYPIRAIRCLFMHAPFTFREGNYVVCRTPLENGWARCILELRSTDSGVRHMQPLQTPHHSLQATPTLPNDPPSSVGELFAGDGTDRFASRCEAQMLVARTKHAD